MKELCSDKMVQESFAPLHGLGEVDVKVEHMKCEVLNMTYFDFLEEYDIVNKHSGHIRGAMDEWHEGMQLCDRLRQAIVLEDDENWCELQDEKYLDEFIFCLFRWLVLGGGMN